MRVKICGITNAEDASRCEELGADALGFVHVPGRSRSLPLDQIAGICSSLGPMITKVLVCSPRSPEDALSMASLAGTDALQLYSFEPEEIGRIRESGVRVIRAVPPDRAEAARFAGCADALLFEQGAPGTGRSYDYSAAPLNCCSRAIIAGGLNLGNLDYAKALKPYAVDVSSGVERIAGKKDPGLVEEFVRRCRS